MPSAAGCSTPHTFGSTGAPAHFVWTSLVERSEPHRFARRLASFITQTHRCEKTTTMKNTRNECRSSSFQPLDSGDIRGWKTTVGVSDIELTASIRHAMARSTCVNALASRSRHDVHVSMLSSHCWTLHPWQLSLTQPTMVSLWRQVTEPALQSSLGNGQILPLGAKQRDRALVDTRLGEHGSGCC